MQAKLAEIKEEMRRRLHRPIPDQGAWPRQVVAGFFGYHAVPTNSRALLAFRHHVTALWLRSLRRRSQTDGSAWERITRLADAWFANRVSFIAGRHSASPSNTQDGSRMRESRTYGSVRGGRPVMGVVTAINPGLGAGIRLAVRGSE